MHRVLVTDAEQRSSLAVVRSLGRAGHHVEVLSTLAAPLAGASRHARACHRVADPTDDVEAFLADVTGLVDERAIEILLPMTDRTATVALGLRERRPGLAIPFPPTRTWEDASDKRELLDVAQRLGVPVPRQVVIEGATADPGNAIAFADRVGYPVILKPHRSAVATPSRVLQFGVWVTTDPDDLLGRLRSLPDEAFPVLVQERIQGAGLGGFFLAREGRVLEAFAHRRLREKPPTGGVSVLRRGVAMRADLRRHSETLLEHFGWSGVAMVEFKEDTASGTLYLMEINGRFWGSLQLAIDCGVDFPRRLIESFAGADTAAGPSRAPEGEASSRSRSIGVDPPGVERGVESRWLWGDVDHLLWLLRAGRGYRDAHPELPGRLAALARFLVPWRPGLRYEVLRLSDPGPFVRESRQWLAHALGRRSR